METTNKYVVLRETMWQGETNPRVRVLGISDSYENAKLLLLNYATNQTEDGPRITFTFTSDKFVIDVVPTV